MELLRRHKDNFIIIGILLLAAFLRLYKIADYLTFLGDEGRDVLVVYNILHGHLTLLGPTASVGGFFLGPIYYYIMAPALFIAGYSPVGPAVMIALFGIVTVWLVYFIGSKFFNKTAGLVAAVLFAINPLIILYSRSSWNPNLMPLTTLLMVFVLYKAVEKNSWRLYLLTGILYGIAMQLHYIEVFMGPMMALYFLIGNIYKPYDKKQKVNFTIKPLLVGIGATLVGFLVGWSPFLAFEARHGFNNLRAIFNFVFHAKDTGQGVGLANFFPTVKDVFFRIFARLILNIPEPDLYNRYPLWQVTFWMISSWIVGIGSIGFLLAKLWQAIAKQAKANREKFLQYILLLLWFGIGVLLFGLYRKNIYDYYFEFLYPVPALLVGGGIAYLFSKRIIKWIAAVVLLGILLINIQGVPFRYPGNRQLQQTETIAREVYNEAGGKPFNFALITGGNSDHAYRYFLTMWGNPPVTILDPQVDPKRASVTKQLIVVCETVPCQPEGNPLWEIAGFGRAQIVSKKHVVVVDVYKLVHYSGK